jgi:hypothetical protein
MAEMGTNPMDGAVIFWEAMRAGEARPVDLRAESGLTDMLADNGRLGRIARAEATGVIEEEAARAIDIGSGREGDTAIADSRAFAADAGRDTDSNDLSDAVDGREADRDDGSCLTGDISTPRRLADE